jgi:hypothetical protein
MGPKILFALLLVCQSPTAAHRDYIALDRCQDAQMDAAIAAIDGITQGLQTLKDTDTLPVGVIRAFLANGREAIAGHKRKH